MPQKKGSDQLPLKKEEIIKDYRLAYQSRQASLIGRREVLSGKAKFGIFGDGKEIINIAIARHFRKGDWRSGYYRDQTWMFMLNVMSIQEFFAQLYAHADVEHESNTGGRSMNAHFANRFINADGSWKNQTELYNTAADVSPTGTQMPRAVGLAYASVLYRGIDELKQFTQFSRNGNEVAWASIGNASAAEGMFWETVNAIGVLKAPAIITIYDDGYGISVPNEYQMTKGNVGDLLEGFQRNSESKNGYDLYRVKAWDYPALIETFRVASETAREEHVPALVHVTEVTQPQGHSTSGSHERYKSAERLKFEEEFDGVHKMKTWMIEKKIATETEFKQWESEDYAIVENIRKIAWDSFLNPILEERGQVMDMLDEIAGSSSHADALSRLRERLANLPSVARRDVHSAAHEALRILRDEANPSKQVLIQWKNEQDAINETRYGSHLYDGTAGSVAEIKPAYSASSPTMMGFEVINAAFDSILERDPRVIAFGEDVGFLGDVNQGFKGMQEKYGALRVSDTGIREATIMGQAIGMAMRGLRPIVKFNISIMFVCAANHER
jgi:TPP-dependent pyruvate/acetoin dehydrogenase alpha subunit